MRRNLDVPFEILKSLIQFFIMEIYINMFG